MSGMDAGGKGNGDGAKGAKKGDDLKISWVDNKGTSDSMTAKIQ